MKYGKVLVDQVTASGDIVEGYDGSLSITEIYDRLSRYFPGLEKDKKSGLLIGFYNDKKYTLRCKNITYLGIPHPIFKKRIQIADDLSDFYVKSLDIDATPLLIGIYEYKDNLLFAEFGIDTYVEKKAHNSSAHVYSSDLVSATTDGFFQKIDYFGNRITVFRKDMVNLFLDTVLSEKDFVLLEDDTKYGFEERMLAYYSRALNDKVIPNIQAFFDGLNKEWYGIDCYREMFDANYSKKGWAEWTGSYLEYKFEAFIDQNQDVHDTIQFYQDRSDGGIDLDLYFPVLDAYGDLKAHNIASRGIPGNDYETVMRILDKHLINSHIYYIIAEHTATKDKDYGSEVTVYWNRLLKKDNLNSYAEKMKHDATVVKAYVLDINNDNRKYLSVFRQGVNSNGRPRAPKIMIEDRNLEHFIIKELNYKY